MMPMGFPRLAAVSVRNRQKRPRPVRPSRNPARTHPMLSVITIAPHMLYSAISMMSEYENRQMQQPLIKLKTLLTRTLQDGLLTALVHYLTKTSASRDGRRDRDVFKTTRRCRVEAKKDYEKAKKLERELDLEGAIQCLERAVRLQPENIRYLGLLSKQYTDMSFATNITFQEARDYNQKALELGKKVVDLSPRDPIGHIACGVSKGRLAYFSNNRQKVELAREAEDAVKNALDLDNSCDLSHHLMGRFHYEMAGLNVFCRAFVRVVYGTTLYPGSYEEALKEFEIAYKLKPDRMIHKIQLGKTYVKLGKKQEAVESLQHALTLNTTDINDHLEHLDGLQLLQRLQKEN